MNSPALSGPDAPLPARIPVAAPPPPAAARRAGRRTLLGSAALLAAVAVLVAFDVLVLALSLSAAVGADLLRLLQLAALAVTAVVGAAVVLKVRQLVQADRDAATAGRETRRILANVQDGLFLLDARFRIGAELNASVHALLGCTVQPGEDFFELIAPMVDAQALAEAREYAELLFAPHVRLPLVADLNPLAAVAVQVTEGRTRRRRYLAFDLRRIDADGDAAPALLVTVRDVGERVALQQQLEEAREQATGELATLVEALAADRDALVAFLGRAEQGLLEINALLEDGRAHPRRDELGRLLEKMARQMHAIKGDAGALQLPLYASLAHAFEDALAALRNNPALDGEALLALPPQLDEMLAKTRLLRRLVSESAAARPGQAATASGPRAQALATTLHALVQNTATELGKRAELRADVNLLDALPPADARALHEAVVQLVRNAVVHGLETPAQRLGAGKLECGLVEVMLRADPGGRAQLVVRDDGAGIDPASVRAYLAASGKLPAEEATALSDHDAVQWLFQPGASTRGAADRHAGRGVGLDVVNAVAERLGGRLRMQTRPGRFCEFSVLFAAGTPPAEARP